MRVSWFFVYVYVNFSLYSLKAILAVLAEKTLFVLLTTYASLLTLLLS